MSTDYLTEIDRFLRYDAETGAIYWRHRPSNRVRRGAAAGTFDPRRGHIIALGGRQYRANEIAWFLGHGEWPEGRIRPINGRCLDLRLDNLEMVSDHS